MARDRRLVQTTENLSSSSNGELLRVERLEKGNTVKKVEKKLRAIDVRRWRRVAQG